MKDLTNVKYRNGRPCLIYPPVKSVPRERIVYGEIRECPRCGCQFFASLSNIEYGNGRGTYCSHRCASTGITGHLAKNWKGGRHINGGYVALARSRHPAAQAGGYVLEHRLVVEQFIGRYLSEIEVVHHVNEIKNDNRPQNLMAFTSDDAHRRFHRGQSVAMDEVIFDGRTYLKEVVSCTSLA